MSFLLLLFLQGWSLSSFHSKWWSSYSFGFSRFVVLFIIKHFGLQI